MPQDGSRALLVLEFELVAQMKSHTSSDLTHSLPLSATDVFPLSPSPAHTSMQSAHTVLGDSAG